MWYIPNEVRRAKVSDQDAIQYRCPKCGVDKNEPCVYITSSKKKAVDPHAPGDTMPGLHYERRDIPRAALIRDWKRNNTPPVVPASASLIRA